MTRTLWHFEILRQPLEHRLEVTVTQEAYRLRFRSAVERWQSFSCEGGIDAAAAVYHIYAKAHHGNALYLAVEGDHLNCVWWLQERLKIAGRLSWQQSRDLFQRLHENTQLVKGSLIAVGLTHDTISDFVEANLVTLTSSLTQPVIRLKRPPQVQWRHRLRRWRRRHILVVLTLVMGGSSWYWLFEQNPTSVLPEFPLPPYQAEVSGVHVVLGSSFNEVISELIKARERGNHQQQMLFTNGQWRSAQQSISVQPADSKRLSDEHIKEQQAWLRQQLILWLPTVQYQVEEERLVRLASDHWHWTELERLRELMRPLTIDFRHIEFAATALGWRGELVLQWRQRENQKEQV